MSQECGSLYSALQEMRANEDLVLDVRDRMCAVYVDEAIKRMEKLERQRVDELIEERTRVCIEAIRRDCDPDCLELILSGAELLCEDCDDHSSDDPVCLFGSVDDERMQEVGAEWFDELAPADWMEGPSRDDGLGVWS